MPEPTKATLILDGARRDEQRAYIAERTAIVAEVGDQLWVAILPNQVERFAEQGIAVQLHPEADLVQVPAGVYDPLVAVPEPPQDLRAPAASATVRARQLVQFVAPPSADWISEITRLGAVPARSLPPTVVVFTMPAEVAEAVRGLPGVRWVGPYQPAYAVGSTLTADGTWLSTPQTPPPIDAARLVASDDGNVQVRLFDDVDPDEAAAAMEAAGAVIRARSPLGHVVSVDHDRVLDLARLEQAFAVEAFVAPQVGNTRAGRILGADHVRSGRLTDFLVNLNGAGEIVGVVDIGLSDGLVGTVHRDLKGRVLEIANLGAPGKPAADLYFVLPDPTPRSHGTHVTGSIIGNGTASLGTPVRGMAPSAFVVFHKLQDSVSPLSKWDRAHAAGARVHSNSWAAAADPLFWPATNNQYGFGPVSSLGIDEWCWEHSDSLVVFLTHNYEADAVPPGGDGLHDMNRLPPESCAKNVLTVGASENQRKDAGWPNTYRAYFGARWPHSSFNALAGGTATGYAMSDDANQVALFSHRGIVTTGSGAAALSTGRVKPDVVAPGTNVLSLRSSKTPPDGSWQDPPAAVAPPADYQLMHGTSMATPLVAGAALLVRQYFRTRFGQLRRPLYLEGVQIASSPPLPAFVDLAAIAPHADGLLVAWTPAGPPLAKRSIRATRMRRNLDSVPSGGPLELEADVGDRPAPALARHGERTLLVHRGKDSAIRLSAFDRNLARDTSFGTGGTVKLTPVSRPDPARPPAVLVADDEVAVVWADGATDTLLMQRFSAATGAAVDTGALTLGSLAHAAPQRYVAHDGGRYAVVWVATGGAGRRLLLRFVGPTGVVGADPLTLVDQAQGIRDPQLLWDARRDGYVLVWCDERSASGGDIRLRFLDRSGATQGTEVVCMPAPSDRTTRRPLLMAHPRGGYALLWEDDGQDAAYDVYLSMLDATGVPDDRIPIDPVDNANRHLTRVSDTPSSTTGATATIDDDGLAIVWQSVDEIDSDRLGVYAVAVTPQGAFAAQADPATPLLRSGRYVGHIVAEQVTPVRRGCSIVSTGGSYFLLRIWPGRKLPELQVVRTDSDGLPDGAYGSNAARVLGARRDLEAVELHWTGDRLTCVAVDPRGEVRVHLLDSDGEPLKDFGTGGTMRVPEAGVVRSQITPAIGHSTTPNFRLIVAYGAGSTGPRQIRYALIDEKGKLVGALRDLAQADGTAAHGWFAFVRSEAHSIAVFHRVVANRSQVFSNRFTLQGAPVLAAEPQLSSTLPGESSNAVVAERPVAAKGDPREYGAVWEHRPAAGQPSELRFSRLQRDGKPMPNPPAPAPPTTEVLVLPPGSPGWPADTDALAPQLVSTFVHQPSASLPVAATAPAWSPGYGLAWLGRPLAGGDRRLYFTVLDENGLRAMLPKPPSAPPPSHAPAPITELSGAAADVHNFKLVWNGRTFRLTWIESEGIATRHMQAALTRHGSQVAHDDPSAALLRATLVNGATNIGNTALPNVNVPGGDRAHGYGWGRVNLRQSLVPSPPVTFQVRDDGALGPGRTALYRFTLPAGTALLRATLSWTDPPGPRPVNLLHLRVTPPGTADVLQGNTWAAPPNAWQSKPVPGGTAYQVIECTEQIVMANPPAGTYRVEVIAEVFPSDPFNQLNVQPFALVFVGSGPEVPFSRIPSGPLPFY